MSMEREGFRETRKGVPLTRTGSVDLGSELVMIIGIWLQFFNSYCEGEAWG